MGIRAPRHHHFHLSAAALALIGAPGAAWAQSTGSNQNLPNFLDDGRLRVMERAVAPAENERRRRAEDDAKRQAEDARRSVEEAMRREELKAEEKRLAKKIRRENEAQRADTPALAKSPTPDAKPESRPGFIYAGSAALAASPAAAAVPKLQPPVRSCADGKLQTSGLPGGRMLIAIDQPCRAGERVVVRYGGLDFVRAFDANGRADIVVDLFLGRDLPLGVELADGSRHGVAIETQDLDRVTKIAIVWKGPVNLDLHAYEYAALRDQPGHIWVGAPSSAEAASQRASAQQRGAGFISADASGAGEGYSVEVYTFWAVAGQGFGNVSLALDYESRGSIPAAQFCGDGALANVPFEVVVRSSDGSVGREKGLIAAARCGEPLAEAARFRRDALPELRVN